MEKLESIKLFLIIMALGMLMITNSTAQSNRDSIKMTSSPQLVNKLWNYLKP